MNVPVMVKTEENCTDAYTTSYHTLCSVVFVNGVLSMNSELGHWLL